jgi:hypothetical protein
MKGLTIDVGDSPKEDCGCKRGWSVGTAPKTKAPRLRLESWRSSNSPPPELLIHKLQSPDSSGNGSNVPLG